MSSHLFSCCHHRKFLFSGKNDIRSISFSTNYIMSKGELKFNLNISAMEVLGVVLLIVNSL